MIGYINKINDNEWKPCNREKFYKIIESKKVERQTEVVRRTGNKAEKDKLPAFIFSGELMAEEYSKYVEEAKAQGIAKKDMKGSRSNQFMKPTGLFIMDFDRDDDQTYQLYDKFKQVMTDNGIELKGFMAAAHRTARGFGLRLVLRRREGMSIFDDQQWIAGLMGEKIDENCKDLARSSFAVPKKDFLYIDDAVRGILSIADGEAPYRVFNLGSGHGTSIREVLDTICRELDLQPEIIWQAGRPVDVPVNYLDISRFETCYGRLDPLPLATGIRKTAAFLKDYYHL